MWSPWLHEQRWPLCFPVRAQESRYVGFGNTVPPPKKDDDFLNSAMSSLYSVSPLVLPRAPTSEHQGPPGAEAGPGPSERSLPSPSRRLLCHSHPRTFSHLVALVTNTRFESPRRVSSKGRMSCEDLGWPPPGSAGPTWPCRAGSHAALPASGKTRFGGRGAGSRQHRPGALWGRHPQPCVVPPCLWPRRVEPSCSEETGSVF